MRPLSRTIVNLFAMPKAVVCLCLGAVTTAQGQAPEKSSVDLTPLTESRKDVYAAAKQCSATI